MDLITGYSIELRIKVNRRWEELEGKIQEMMVLLQSSDTKELMEDAVYNIKYPVDFGRKTHVLFKVVGGIVYVYINALFSIKGSRFNLKTVWGKYYDILEGVSERIGSEMYLGDSDGGYYVSVDAAVSILRETFKNYYELVEFVRESEKRIRGMYNATGVEIKRIG